MTKITLVQIIYLLTLLTKRSNKGVNFLGFGHFFRQGAPCRPLLKDCGYTLVMLSLGDLPNFTLKTFTALTSCSDNRAVLLLSCVGCQFFVIN